MRLTRRSGGGGRALRPSQITEVSEIYKEVKRMFNNGCGNDMFLILILLCCCGCGNAGNNCGCGYDRKGGCDCCDMILLYLLLSCCCGGGRDMCCK